MCYQQGSPGKEQSQTKDSSHPSLDERSQRNLGYGYHSALQVSLYEIKMEELTVQVMMSSLKMTNFCSQKRRSRKRTKFGNQTGVAGTAESDGVMI